MKVFILEDEPVQQFRMESMIEGYVKEKKYHTEGVASYGKIRDLLEALEDYPQNNLYFLDIGIKNKHHAGLEVAEKIRQLDPIGQITFVTTHHEFAAITYEYKVNAHDFVDKMLPKNSFEQRILDNVDYFFDVNRMKPLNQIFSYHSKTGKYIEALYADIYYIETTGKPHKLILQMACKVISFYGSMDDIQKMTDKLVRIHRSYLINIDRMKCYLKKEKLIILDDETELPVSRSGARMLRRILK